MHTLTFLNRFGAVALALILSAPAAMAGQHEGQEGHAGHDHGQHEEKMMSEKDAHAEGMQCCSAAAEAGLKCGICHPDAKAKVGEKAVNFQLKDTEGKTHQIADHSDSIVVLTWANEQCPFFEPHLEAKTVDKLAQKYGDDDVVFYYIDSTSTHDAEAVKKTEEKFDLAVPVLLDFEGDVGRAYEAKTTPHVMIIDKEGKLVYNGALDNAPLGKVDGDEKVNYIEHTLTKLMAGETPDPQTTKPYGCAVKYSKKDKDEAPKETTRGGHEPGTQLGSPAEAVSEGCCPVAKAECAEKKDCEGKTECPRDKAQSADKT